MCEDSGKFKTVNPSKTQDLFAHIVKAAEKKGMLVNRRKKLDSCASQRQPPLSLEPISKTRKEKK